MKRIQDTSYPYGLLGVIQFSAKDLIQLLIESLNYLDPNLLKKEKDTLIYIDPVHIKMMDFYKFKGSLCCDPEDEHAFNCVKLKHSYRKSI